jgi:hypothetical protein
MKMSKRETWHTIEGKHFGQCCWQQRSPNGKGLMEGLIHKATGRIMIVEKMYEAKLPSMNSSKPWPELESINVYSPVDFETNTWTGLDAALAEFGAKLKQVA